MVGPLWWLILFPLISFSISDHLLHTVSEDSGILSFSEEWNVGKEDEVFCESWRFSVETNNAGNWRQVPERCIEYVKDYLTGERYISDSEMVARDSYRYAKTINLAGDGTDAWIFDIDETLLSNLPYYAVQDFGTKKFNETTFNEWVSLSRAPPLLASLKLYKWLCRHGFQIILLTGRIEAQRSSTIDNLIFAGYHSWERLILREHCDEGLLATIYKSKKRTELISQGFQLHGNSGDQWSDLLGDAMARRSFKLPNLLYHIK